MTPELVVLPSQYVVARVVAPTAGWTGAGPWVFTFTGVDSLNGRTFTGTATVTKKQDTVVLRCGPFMTGGTADLTIATPGVADWTGELLIANTHSPASIVRQAVFDILLAAASTLGGDVLSDGMYRPEVAMEDTPFTGGVLIEVGASGTSRKKVSVARCDGRCRLSIFVRAAGSSMSEGLVLCDDVAWRVQRAVDASGNLGLSTLGCIDWSWVWDAQLPEEVEVQGSPIPAVEQELRFEVVLHGVN